VAQKRRGELLASVHDLKVEWATRFPHLSVRAFLIDQKGFKDRRYRYIMKQSPSFEWVSQREDVRAGVATAVIKKHIDGIVEVHSTYISASKLALARAVKVLSSDDSTPHELLAATKAIEISQGIYKMALGTPEGYGLIQIEKQIKETQVKEPSALRPKYTYDEIKMMIEIRREQKAKLRKEVAPSNSRLQIERSSTEAALPQYSCLRPCDVHPTVKEEESLSG